MDLFHAAVLIAAGIVGGTIATLVGGASIVTFPALLAAGLPPVSAIASNMVALTPGILVSAYVERHQLPTINRAFVSLVFVSTVGAVAGAVLLLLTPSRTFEFIIPVLIGGATILFACGGRISAWLRARSLELHGREPEIGIGSYPILLPVSIYNGYFGAGAGVMLLAVFSVWNGGNYRAANVTKNLVTSLNSILAAGVLAVQGAVDWRAAGLMMMGGFVGSALGVRIARVAPRHLIQIMVVVIGVLMTLIYVWRYWL